MEDEFPGEALKTIAAKEQAMLWPNHDLAFWKSLRHFPEFHD